LKNQADILRKAFYFPDIISHVFVGEQDLLLECMCSFDGMNVHLFVLVNSYKE